VVEEEHKQITTNLPAPNAGDWEHQLFDVGLDDLDATSY
jgi:hypothetical protein